MGSSQSVLTPEAAVVLAVAAGAIGLGYKQLGQAAVQGSGTSQAPSSSSKKGKKKKKQPSSQLVQDELPPASAPPPAPTVSPVLDAIPGAFEADKGSSAPAADDATPPSKAGKGKKKKKTKSTAPASASSSLPKVVPSPNYDSESSIGGIPTPATKAQAQPSTTTTTSSKSQAARALQPSIDTDGSWSRVESGRRKRGKADASVDVTTTDAGITTPFTGNSSPIAERTEDESFLLSSRASVDDKRPLAERLLPQPAKTGVDDMLETPDHPTLARVMRVQPRPDEKPASGFSWGDYEDVQVADSAGGGNDADGEDEGWGIVKRKRSNRTPLSSSQASSSQTPREKASEPTKRQRQNARKREDQKAAKADGEAERLAALAQHKKALEQERMLEQFKKSGSGKIQSGGMKATVDAGGKLVWE